MVQLRLTLLKVWMFVNGFTLAAQTILRDPRLIPNDKSTVIVNPAGQKPNTLSTDLI